VPGTGRMQPSEPDHLTAKALKDYRQPIDSLALSPTTQEGIVVADIRKSFFQYAFFEPHRSEHYFLLINNAGSYSVKLDFQKFQIDKPAFLFIAPEQVHQVLRIKDLQGYCISFDKASVYSDMERDLKRISNVPVLLELLSCKGILVSFVDLLHDLQQVPSNLFVQRASQGVLHALLNLMASQSISSPHVSKRKRASVIGSTFMMLLENNYKEWKEPSRYAQALAISTNHLNYVIKALTGKSVTAHIHNLSILEAKRLLHFTDLSVKEICYETGFRHAIYFNKLFKKITGMTPLEFRNKFHV
jgi:AraC family transcriptional regulator, transcriptional activator of pobA